MSNEQSEEKNILGVGFEEPTLGIDYTPRAPKIVRWVVKHSRGLIKSDKQASFILWVFVVVALYVSYSLISSQNQSNNEANKPLYPVDSSAFTKK